jgi:hypothetical protein
VNTNWTTKASYLDGSRYLLDICTPDVRLRKVISHRLRRCRPVPEPRWPAPQAYISFVYQLVIKVSLENREASRAALVDNQTTIPWRRCKNNTVIQGNLARCFAAL